MVFVKIPELGEDIEKVMVSCWYVKRGDKVKEDDDIVELTTDKATFNVSSPATGVMKEIFVKEGEEAKVGENLAVIE